MIEIRPGTAFEENEEARENADAAEMMAASAAEQAAAAVEAAVEAEERAEAAAEVAAVSQEVAVEAAMEAEEKAAEAAQTIAVAEVLGEAAEEAREAAEQEGAVFPSGGPGEEPEDLEFIYRRVRERRHHPSGVVLYDVAYGAKDRQGHPRTPGNGDGHGHKIYVILNGEEHVLVDRQPDQEAREAATRERDEQDLHEAFQSELLKDLERVMEEKRQLVRSAELLSRRGIIEEDGRSMADLEKAFAALSDHGTEREKEYKDRFDRSLSQYEGRKAEWAEHKTAKEALIQEAAACADTEDFRGTEAVMAEQMEKWKQIGSAGAEDQALWEQFYAHRQRFYERRKAHFDELKSRRAEVRVIKEGLIKEAAEASQDIGNWKESSARMNEIFDRWKAAGSAGHTVDEKLWEQFCQIRRDFKEKRNEFFKERDQEREEVARKKEEILRKAQLISASHEYTPENSEAMKQFNVEWKAAGSAGHDTDERLWNLYRKAQDEFWEGKHNEHALARKEYTDKLEDAIARKTTQIENLQNQIYHLKDKMHSVQNPGYLINMEGWVQEKEAAIRDLKAQIEQMSKRL